MSLHKVHVVPTAQEFAVLNLKYKPIMWSADQRYLLLVRAPMRADSYTHGQPE